jgi:GT2 family glycosyltransferase
VLNYQTPDMTLRCVRSLYEQEGEFDLHVSIVDNASGGDSEVVLRQGMAGLVPVGSWNLIVAKKNGGFSAGHNTGIAASHSRYHLVINSDTLVLEGALAALIATAEREPALALVAPQLEGENAEVQTSCFRMPTPWSELIRGACTALVTRVLHRFNVPLEQSPRAEDIAWVSFACVLLRDEAIQQVGPMDDGFFLYFEDTDYCARLRGAGWQLDYCPEARVVHFRGGSGPVKSLTAENRRLPAYWYASRTRLFYKLYGRFGLLLANLAWHCGRGIGLVRVLVGKPVPRANAAEWRDIWTNFFAPLGDSRAPDA